MQESTQASSAKQPLGGSNTHKHAGLHLQNELLWRRHRERIAVAQADAGSMAPLVPQHSSARHDSSRSALRGGVDRGARGPADFGSTFGTELLEPGPLRWVWRQAAKAVRAHMPRGH